MAYVKYFPRDAKVMAQEYNDYEERANKARQVLDFQPLVRVIDSGAPELADGELDPRTLPELLAEAVAAELNTAYDRGFYNAKNLPKDMD
jgi:hypothetical protein